MSRPCCGNVPLDEIHGWGQDGLVMPGSWQSRVREVALGWIGTPYRPHGQIKGPRGGIDCGTLLIGVFSELGVIPFFTPSFYEPQAAQTQAGEAYLKEILKFADPCVPPWVPGDVFLFRMPWAASCGHAAIYLGRGEIIHAMWGRQVMIAGVRQQQFQRRLEQAFRARE